MMGGRPMMRWGMMPLGLDGVRISFLNNYYLVQCRRQFLRRSLYVVDFKPINTMSNAAG